MPQISDALTLPNGLVLPNRLAKAAMTEGLADPHNQATARHGVLYRRWAASGLGLLITGNVQIDRAHLERGGNIAIAGPQSAEARAGLAALAEAAKSRGGKVFMQLNHAGRQTPIAINKTPAAPSAIGLNLPGKGFGAPRALTEDEILSLVGRFGEAAAVARDTGFDGVQLHAAHGYLISQFLSPKANRRSDAWGGTPENRRRFLVEALRAMRAKAGGGNFAFSVKLNAADFLKGGFTFEECLEVVRVLNGEGVDLLEISGGTYEQPKMAGWDGVLEPVFESGVPESTRAREAYFTRYAAAIAKIATMPLMVTGGFRSRAGMETALNEGSAQVIGLGRPLCGAPDAAGPLLAGTADTLPTFEHMLRLGPGLLSLRSPVKLIALINAMGTQGWYYEQLYRIADGLEPAPAKGVLGAFLRYQKLEAEKARALAA